MKLGTTLRTIESSRAAGMSAEPGEHRGASVSPHTWLRFQPISQFLGIPDAMDVSKNEPPCSDSYSRLGLRPNIQR